MRILFAVMFLASVAHAADSPAFSVASVKASARIVGKDYRKPITVGEDRVSGHNVSLKDLLIVAYGMEPFRILGPGWIDDNEYDVEARADGPITREQMRGMLQRLLTERFQIASHREPRMVKAHMLEIERSGFKALPRITKGFHVDTKELARLISIQLTIPAISDPTRPSMASGPPVPVFDNTGLTGIYDFPVDISPSPGEDMYEVWQRRLHEVGLRLNSRQVSVTYVVIDRAEKVPTAN
ncbi:MAG: hypothetical protein JWP63_1090 [Candidatus Solibacter sp.]|jgi:uncharacterized protein (TIGR03435 family)|nr:hypothetical protein [Candidatus Solibacter sp.]